MDKCNMEHINIKPLGDSLFLLTPDKGYKLYNEVTQRTYSEATCQEGNVKDFIAVTTGEGGENGGGGGIE